MVSSGHWRGEGARCVAGCRHISTGSECEHKVRNVLGAGGMIRKLLIQPNLAETHGIMPPIPSSP